LTVESNFVHTSFFRANAPVVVVKERQPIQALHDQHVAGADNSRLRWRECSPSRLYGKRKANARFGGRDLSPSNPLRLIS
jgi:hypothetical protein